MWLNDYEALSNGEQERFRKLVNYLLNKTYVVSEVYEPRDRVGKINGDYRYIERNFDLFSGYLELAGYTLVKDDARGIISINSQYGFNVEKLDKFETLFLLTLRTIYDEEREKNASKNVVFVRVNEVIYRMLEDKLLIKKPTIKETTDIVRNLIRHNILSRIEGAVEEANCLVTIYPTILKVVSNEKLSAIYALMFKETDLDTNETYDFDNKEVEE